jgi:uncharacterized membrane protein YfcA
VEQVLAALLMAAVAFGAALIGGVAGFGFSLIGIAALTLVLDPKTAVIAFSLVAPLLSAVQLYHHRSHRAVANRLWLLLACAAIGSIIGTNLLLTLPSWVLSIALGCFALFYVLATLRSERPPLAPQTERLLGPVIGLTAGVFNGSLGASGPVVGSYLHAIGLHKREFAFAISSVFLLMGVVRAASLAVLGAYTAASFAVSASLFVPAVVGQQIGFAVQSRIDQRRFEFAVLALLTLSALNLIVKGVAGAGAP